MWCGGQGPAGGALLRQTTDTSPLGMRHGARDEGGGVEQSWSSLKHLFREEGQWRSENDVGEDARGGGGKKV